MLQLSFCYHLQRWQHNQSAHLLLCIRLFNRISSCFRKLSRAKKDNHDVNLAKWKFLMFHHAWRNILLLTAFRACLSSSLILECPVIEVTIEFIEQRKSKQWSISVYSFDQYPRAESWEKSNLFIHVNTLMLGKASFQGPLINKFHPFVADSMRLRGAFYFLGIKINRNGHRSKH